MLVKNILTHIISHHAVRIIQIYTDCCINTNTHLTTQENHTLSKEYTHPYNQSPCCQNNTNIYRLLHKYKYTSNHTRKSYFKYVCTQLFFGQPEYCLQCSYKYCYMYKKLLIITYNCTHTLNPVKIARRAPKA